MNWSSFFILSLFHIGMVLFILANMYVRWYERQEKEKQEK